MDIGLSSAVFYPNVESEDSIKIMSELGFKCTEIFLNTPAEFEDDFIKKLVEEKNKYKLNINSVHSFSSLFEPYLFDTYKRRRDDMIKYFEKVCVAAKKLGASIYTFHGMRLGRLEELDFKFVREVYSCLTYIAGENDVKLAQENVAWCMASNLDYLREIRNSDKYDLYFTIDIKQAYKAGVKVFDYLDIMGDRLVNFHVNDRDDKNVCLLPGKGKVNLQAVFDKLKEKQYKGNAIIEVYSENYREYKELSLAKKLLEGYL